MEEGEEEEEDWGFGGGLRKLRLRRDLQREIGACGGISVISPSFWGGRQTFRIELNSHIHGEDVADEGGQESPVNTHSLAQNPQEDTKEQALVSKAQDDLEEGIVGIRRSHLSPKVKS